MIDRKTINILSYSYRSVTIWHNIRRYSILFSDGGNCQTFRIITKRTVWKASIFKKTTWNTPGSIPGADTFANAKLLSQRTCRSSFASFVWYGSAFFNSCIHLINKSKFAQQTKHFPQTRKLRFLFQSRCEVSDEKTRLLCLNHAAFMLSIINRENANITSVSWSLTLGLTKVHVHVRWQKRIMRYRD